MYLTDVTAAAGDMWCPQFHTGAEHNINIQAAVFIRYALQCLAA